MAAASAAVVALTTPAVADAYSDQQALADLNSWRAEVGVPAATSLDAELGAACAAHNQYMALNGMSHSEDQGKPGYSERGTQAGRASVLHYGSDTASPRQMWEEAVYHRTSLLKPRLRTTWFAANNGFGCMGTLPVYLYDPATETSRTVTPEDDGPSARTPGLVAYPSPANGVQGVPPSFQGNESPDPRQAIAGNPQEPGWLLSVLFNGPWDRDLDASLSFAGLTPDGGAPVAISPQDSGTLYGTALDGGVGIFPNAPLAPNTWYTARVAGTKYGSVLNPSTSRYDRTAFPFDVTWRFRSGVREHGNERNDPTPDPDPKTRAARAVSLKLAGTLHGGKLALRVRAGRGALTRKAALQLYIPKRTCRRGRCRTRWQPLGRRKTVKLNRSLIKRTYKVARRDKRVRVHLKVSGYRAKAGQRWKTTTAKRTVTRR